MEMQEKVVDGIKTATDIFKNLYDTYDKKVNLLRSVYNDKAYAKNCENSKPIYEAINILGKNAEEEKPRRYQQQFLASLVKMMMSNPSYESLKTFFNENPVHFDAFCLMYIHFQDDAVSEKERQAHEFMTRPLINCVELLINN